MKTMHGRHRSSQALKKKLERPLWSTFGSLAVQAALCGYGSIIRYRSSLGVKFRSVPCLNSPLQGEFVPWRLWPPWKCFCRRCVRHCGDLMNIHLHNLISSYLQYILPFAHGLAFVWCFHTTRVLAPFGSLPWHMWMGQTLIPWDEHFRCSPGPQGTMIFDPDSDSSDPVVPLPSHGCVRIPKTVMTTGYQL